MLTDLVQRLRALFRRSTVEQELDEELRFHLERQIESYMASGLDRTEAVRRANLEFGGLDQVKEEYRDALGVRLADDCARDFRIAVRSLRATPLVTAAAILSLALAIGANTAIFSIIDSLLLRQLPVRDAERLVLVTDTVQTRLRPWTYPIWQEFRQRPHLFENIAAWSAMRFNLASGGEIDPVNGLWATGSFFETLGVRALVGRTFSTADDQRPSVTRGPQDPAEPVGATPRGGLMPLAAHGSDTALPVAVISHRFWQRRFGGADDVIGQTLRLNTVPFIIIGVTPPDFLGPDVGRSFDVIVPLEQEPLIRGRETYLDSYGTNFLFVIARLPPGQTIDGATAALRSAQPQIREATLGDLKTVGSADAIERYLKEPFTVVPGGTGYSALRLRYERALLTIMAIVTLVLLVACVNIANLLLARANARRHELSVRLALGASRMRLVRQLLTESLVLSASGAALGLLIAVWVSEALVQELSTQSNAIVLDLPIDARILAFTTALTALTTMLFGTAPAFRSTRVQPIDAVKEHGRANADHSRSSVAGWLVASQVALSTILVVAAGLFVRSFVSLTTRDLGFQPDQVLVVTMDTQRAGVDPTQRIQLYVRARDAVASLPNVANAAVSFLTPLGGGYTPPVEISGVPLADTSNGEVFGNLISPEWFETFGTPLVSGRGLTDRDRGGPRAAVVNEAFARRFFAGRNPLGQTIVVYAGRARALPPMEIVGVVRDAVYASVREPAPPTWYAPIEQFNLPFLASMLTTARLSVRPDTGPPAMLTRSVAEAVAGVNPHLSLTFQPLASSVGASLVHERLTAILAGAFGALALLLAALGLYGVTSYAVSRRRTEIGIRVAIGAAPRSVIRLVMARTAFLVAIGVGVGIGVSLWASKFVATLVYGLPPRDPATLIGAAVVLAAIGLLAAWLPARQAARIDPVATLRES